MIGVGKYVGAGMIVGWHSFMPDENRERRERLKRLTDRRVLGDAKRVVRLRERRQK